MKRGERARAGISSGQSQRQDGQNEAMRRVMEANVFRWVGQLLRAGLERDKHPVEESAGPLEHPRGVEMDSALNNSKCRTGDEYRAKARELCLIIADCAETTEAALEAARSGPELRLDQRFEQN